MTKASAGADKFGATERRVHKEPGIRTHFFHSLPRADAAAACSRGTVSIVGRILTRTQKGRAPSLSIHCTADSNTNRIRLTF